MYGTELKPKTRRKRRWVPTARGLELLSRSAQQVARSSATRIARPDTQATLARVKGLMELERLCKLTIGDLLVELVDGHGLRPIDIARETGRRPSDLSEMIATARAFPANSRSAYVPYNSFLLAVRMSKRFPELKLRPEQALRQITSQRLSQHRDASRHFARLAISQAALRPQLSFTTGGGGDIQNEAFQLNQAHHCRFQDLLGRFVDGTIDLLHIDPPYLYPGGTYSSRSASSLTCASDDPQAAANVVIDLLRDWQPKLSPNGVALLWQPWGMLSPRIAEAIERYQWAAWGPIIWDKGRPQPGNFSSPYSVQGEMVWMLHRLGEQPLNRDGGTRESILRFRPVSFPGTAARQAHAFEKPLDLMRHLLQKHTRPGGLVFDACGCTDVMSVAAIELGRTWMYAELNADNFKVGRERIEQANERQARSVHATGLPCTAPRCSPDLDAVAV